MSVFVVGLNHRSASLALLERVGVPELRLEKALAQLKSKEHVLEAVVVSTCNRMEIYACSETFHGAYESVREFMSEFSFTPLEDFTDNLYSYVGPKAVSHLFCVVSGLDSAVLGEAEIQGQVKRAWQIAQQEGTAGPEMNQLFRQALGTGKKVRSATQVGATEITSVCAAAVALLQQELTGRKALILGSGEVGQTAVRILSESDMAEVCVASRTWQRASHLAESVGGRAIHLDELKDELVGMDFLFTATGSPSIMLERSEVQEIMGRRGERSDNNGTNPSNAPQLIIVDLAVPRDIDPSVGDIEGVKLLDIEDIQSFAENTSSGSLEEMHKAHAIINEEVQSYVADNSALLMAPLIVDFRQKICDISQTEFDKFAHQLQSLTTDQRETVELLVHNIINKVLHDPTVRIKEVADTDEADTLADALRDLFGLQD